MCVVQPHVASRRANRLECEHRPRLQRSGRHGVPELHDESAYRRHPELGHRRPPVSVGGEFGRFEREGHEYFSAAPTFAFDGLRSGSGWGYADFFLGVPRSVTQNSPLNSVTSRLNVAAYVQDDWKVADRLTVNLGLRYEPFLPIKENDNKLSAFREGQQSTIYPLAPKGVLFPGDAGIGRGIVSSQQKVAPRVGVAYDPRGEARPASAAYGVFYDTIRLVALNTNNLNQPFTLGVTSIDPFSLTNPYLGKEATLALLQTYTAPSLAQGCTELRPARPGNSMTRTSSPR